MATAVVTYVDFPHLCAGRFMSTVWAGFPVPDVSQSKYYVGGEFHGLCFGRIALFRGTQTQFSLLRVAAHSRTGLDAATTNVLGTPPHTYCKLPQASAVLQKSDATVAPAKKLRIYFTGVSWLLTTRMDVTKKKKLLFVFWFAKDYVSNYDVEGATWHRIPGYQTESAFQNKRFHQRQSRGSTVESISCRWVRGVAR